MISIKSEGDFKDTRNFLNKISRGGIFTDLRQYAEMGVEALSRATPQDTGLASRSWAYRILRNKKRYKIVWYNTDVENGQSVVILIQYGHATRGGTFIHGIDFINPAMRPVFEKIADDIWKKVKSYG